MANIDQSLLLLTLHDAVDETELTAIISEDVQLSLSALDAALRGLSVYGDWDMGLLACCLAINTLLALRDYAAVNEAAQHPQQVGLHQLWFGLTCSCIKAVNSAASSSEYAEINEQDVQGVIEGAPCTLGFWLEYMAEHPDSLQAASSSSDSQRLIQLDSQPIHASSNSSVPTSTALAMSALALAGSTYWSC